MAVVATYQFGPCTVEINDFYLAQLTPEELEANKKRFFALAEKILLRDELRKQGFLPPREDKK